MSQRQRIWNKLAVEWRPDRVHDQVRTIDFDELPTHSRSVPEGAWSGAGPSCGSLRTPIRSGDGELQGAASPVDHRPRGFWRANPRSSTGRRRSPRSSITRDRRSPSGSAAAGSTSATTPSIVISPRAASRSALIYISTETGETKRYTYRELAAEVNRCAAIFKAQGVGRGDRVLIYMPMIAEAAFAMLACVRIGAIHSVGLRRFRGGEPRHPDRRRRRRRLMVTSDAGMRGGKPVLYKHLVDEALRLATNPPRKVVIVNRGLDPGDGGRAGRDVDYASLRSKHDGRERAMRMARSRPSRRTSSHVRHDRASRRASSAIRGGYAGRARVVDAPHLLRRARRDDVHDERHRLGGRATRTSSTRRSSPARRRSCTKACRSGPMPAIWWKIVAGQQGPDDVQLADRDPGAEEAGSGVHDAARPVGAQVPVPRRRAARRADAHAGPRIRSAWPIVDNYWQTETGWPILSAQPGVEDTPRKFGTPSLPGATATTSACCAKATGEKPARTRRRVLCDRAAAAPGLHDARSGATTSASSTTYFSDFGDKLAYSTFDWATRDADGYYFVLGRTDDVINVAGHRLGTREIEEAVQAHAGIAEVAVVGVADAGQGPGPRGVRRREGCLEGGSSRRRRANADEVLATVDRAARRDRAPGARPLSSRCCRRPGPASSAAHDPGARRRVAIRAT